MQRAVRCDLAQFLSSYAKVQRPKRNVGAQCQGGLQQNARYGHQEWVFFRLDPAFFWKITKWSIEGVLVHGLQSTRVAIRGVMHLVGFSSGIASASKSRVRRRSRIMLLRLQMAACNGVVTARLEAVASRDISNGSHFPKQIAAPASQSRSTMGKSCLVLLR